jgi:hypothetical protein
MAAVPVMVGSLKLKYVQSMSISEGYQIARIAGSAFSQAVKPTTKKISIRAVLVGPYRLVDKIALEALALTSRLLVAATAPVLAIAGIPVISGLTMSLDMQITSLQFTQSVERREAIDVAIELDYVPRSGLAALASAAGDIALAAATAALPSGPPPNPIPRAPVPVVPLTAGTPIIAKPKVGATP